MPLDLRGEIRRGRRDGADTDAPPKLLGWQRSLVALLKRTPHAYGWCRTRWSCATLCLQMAAGRGYTVARETIRRTLHHLGYAWKRARHAARGDDDPDRASKLACIRHLVETLPRNAALFFANELDIALLPKLGYEWMLRGTQTQVMTPGANQKNYLAGARWLRDGQAAPLCLARYWVVVGWPDTWRRRNSYVKFTSDICCGKSNGKRDEGSEL